MIKGRCEAKLELKQGKKREVRRIFRSVKIKLFSLHRISFGSINIGSLKIGESRSLKIKLFSLHRVSFGSINIGSLKTGESRLLEENEIKNLKNKN